MILDFAQVCILAAFVLAVFSIRGYRLIATILFINFMLFEAFAVTMIEALGDKVTLPLHMVYVVISGLTVLTLVYLRASPALYTIMLLYSVYNLMIVIEFPFFDRFGFALGIHDNFKPVARTQMAIELLFMLLISKWSAYVWNKFRPNSKYHYFIDRFFSDCWRMGGKRLV